MSSSTRQLERMLALVPYLQVHEGVPVAELAQRFGVPQKLIQREIMTLALTGTRPTHGEMIDLDYAGLDEGLAFIRNADFMARPLRLTVLEGASLVAALGVLRQIAETDQTDTIDQVTAKIHSALSPQHDPSITVHLNAPAEDIRRSVNEAIELGRQLKVRYVSDHSDSESVRIIDPYKVTVERAQVYLSAWCHLAEGQRIFRLDRISEADVLTTPITRDPMEPSPALFDFGEHGFQAVLDVDPIARWIVEPCQPEHMSELPGGVIRVRVHAMDEQWMVRLIMSGGGAIRVVEPDALAQRLRAAAALALDAYDRTQ